MLENGKISPSQFGILIFMFSLGTPIIRIPGVLISAAKQDAWISVLFAMVISLGVVYLYHSLAIRFPNETIVQYSERILGKWLGKLISLSFIWYFLYLGAYGLRGVGDFLTTAILVETPIDVVEIVFMVAVIYGVKLGLEVIGRAGEVLIPWVIMMALVISVFLLPQMEFTGFSPVLPVGWGQPSKGLYSLLGTPITQLIVFLMIFPFVKRHQQAKKWFYAGILLNLLFIFFIIIAAITVLGVDLASRSIYPTFAMVRKVEIGALFERIEAIVAGIWFVTIFIKVALLLYITNLATAQLFNLQNYRPFVLPFAIIMLALSLLLSPDISHLNRNVAETWPTYSFFQGIVIPAFLLLVAVVRKLRN